MQTGWQEPARTGPWRGPLLLSVVSSLKSSAIEVGGRRHSSSLETGCMALPELRLDPSTNSVRTNSGSGFVLREFLRSANQQPVYGSQRSSRLLRSSSFVVSRSIFLVEELQALSDGIAAETDGPSADRAKDQVST